MPTKNQLTTRLKTRISHPKKGTRSKALCFRPQRRGICYKVGTMKPKKPNSAHRRIVKVRVLHPNRRLTCYVPGRGAHDLRNYSQVLIRGGQVCDLPGVQYQLIRGKKDLTWRESFIRKHARSKYGTPSDPTQTYYK